MALLRTEITLETGDLSEFYATSGLNITADSGVAFSGTYSLKIANTSGTSFVTIRDDSDNEFGGTVGYVRFWFRTSYLPASPTTILRIQGKDGGTNYDFAELRLNSGGTITMYGYTNNLGTSSVTLSVDTWYKIDVYVQQDSGGSQYAELYIDDSYEITNSFSEPFDTCLENVILAKNPGSTGSFYFDGILIDDSEFPGSSSDVYANLYSNSSTLSGDVEYLDPVATYTADGSLTSSPSTLGSDVEVVNPPAEGDGSLASSPSTLAGEVEVPIFADGLLASSPSTLSSDVLFDESYSDATGTLSTGNSTLEAMASYLENNIQVSFLVYQGSSLEVPIEVSIAYTSSFPIQASILSPSIDPPYQVIAAHAGQGIILLQWQHDTHDLVEYYELNASEDGVNYFTYQRGSFVERHGVVHNVPLGSSAWFKVRAVGKNGAISAFVNAVRGKLELPLVPMQVTAIKGSVIPQNSRFTSIDEETGALVAIKAEDSINIQ